MICRLSFCCTLCVCFAVAAKAQDDSSVSILKKFFHGKVWAVDWACNADSCYEYDDYESFYWVNGSFFPQTYEDTTSFCFSIQSAFYMMDPATEKMTLYGSGCTPLVCLLNNTENSIFNIRHTSEAGIYYMTLKILSDNSFQMEGTSAPNDLLVERYIVVEPPEELHRQ